MHGNHFKTWARRITATILYFNVLVFVCSLTLFLIDTTLHPYMDDSVLPPILLRIFYEPLRYIAGNYFMFLLPFVGVCIVIIFTFTTLLLITRNSKFVSIFQSLKLPYILSLISIVPVMILFCGSFLAAIVGFDLLWSLSPIVLLLILYIGGFGAYLLFRKLFLTFPEWLRRVLNIFAALLLVAITLPILYIASEFFQENQPSLYVDINLDDPHGRYVLNYDGDYWLTYYTDENKCYEKINTICTPAWKKTGNTSVSYAPFPLNPLLDKPVRVTGEFVPISHSLNVGDNGREFCMITECVPSRGPGTWYRSPLKISTIELE